jgi:hypothetical protein
VAGKLKREATLIGQLYESGRLQRQHEENWRVAVRGSSPPPRPE